MPSVRTVRQWYSSVNGKLGFNEEACNMLLLLSSKYREGKMLTAALINDEMAIRELIEYNGKKFTGYVDTGLNIDDDSLPIANNALVFMVVGLKEWFRLIF